MLSGTVTGIRNHDFLFTCLGPFWEDDVFGAQTKPLQLTIVLFLSNLKNFPFIFLNIDVSNVPAEQAAYRNVCHWFGG